MAGPADLNRARQTDSSTTVIPNRTEGCEPPPRLDDIQDLTSPIAGETRTAMRVNGANEEDASLTGEYLPSSAFAVIPTVVKGPDDVFIPPSWLMESLRQTIKEGTPTPRASEFHFETSEEAVNHNTNLLELDGFDLGRLINKQQGTTVWHGAEFRTLPQLERTFGQHPNFPFMQEVMSDGMTYYFTEELTETERLQELTANLDRGNHKSAMDDKEALHDMLKSDVTKGFALPIHRAYLKSIKGVMVQPAGLAEQFTLTSEGDRVPKKRLTHDLSYSITKDNASVNNRMWMSSRAFLRPTRTTQNTAPSYVHRMDHLDDQDPTDYKNDMYRAVFKAK